MPMPQESFTREVVAALKTGPLCAKWIATGRFRTRFSVEHALNELRRSWVIDTSEPCRSCGTRESAVTLEGEGRVDGSLGRAATLRAASRTPGP
jgi:hypothetical protein